MPRARVLFAIAVLVAIMWTAWLVYLMKTAADPVVVSAPQVHFASLVVVGTVTPGQPHVKVAVTKVYKDMLFGVQQKPLPKELLVKEWPSNLKISTEPMLLALMRVPGEEGVFELAPVPVPTGFFNPRVYVFTESVRLQVERILGGN
jgi:hypothetical protein